MRDFDEVEVIPCITLQLECYEDDLSPAQLKAFEKAEKEHNEIRSKLDDIVKGSENVFSGDIFKAYHLSGDAPSTLGKIARPIAEIKKEVKKVQAQQTKQKVVETVKLPTSGTTRSRTDYKKRSYTEIDADDYVDDEYMPLSKKLAKIKEKNKTIKKEYSPPPPSTPPPLSKSGGRKPASKSSTGASPTSTQPIIAPNVRPSENTAVGGLSIGNETKKPKEEISSVVDLTSNEDGGNKSAAADSREISFNKIQGKTFPSLVVVARPCLKAKDNLPSDRAALDAKVKGNEVQLCEFLLFEF